VGLIAAISFWKCVHAYIGKVRLLMNVKRLFIKPKLLFIILIKVVDRLVWKFRRIEECGSVTSSNMQRWVTLNIIKRFVTVSPRISSNCNSSKIYSVSKWKAKAKNDEGHNFYFKTKWGKEAHVAVRIRA